MKKKFQGLRIAQVTERLSAYRLHFNDNSMLDLPKIELGSFVPQKGMFVRLQFYRNLVLQKVEFDGVLVINYDMVDLMTKLSLIDDKLEEDVRKETANIDDIVYDKLPKVFKQRVDMLGYITKLPIFQDCILDEAVIDYETAVCYLAQKLAQLGKDYVNDFRHLPLISQQAVLLDAIDLPMIEDIIDRAEAFIDNLIDEMDDNYCLENSAILNMPYCIQITPEEHQSLVKAYVDSLKNQ